MKPLFLLAICAAGLMTTACSNEDSPLESSSEVPVSLFVEGVNSTSRSTTTDQFVTTFQAQDKIGIFSTGLQADMSNTEFTYASSNSALTSQDTYKFKADTQADFYAYFPYSAEASAKEVVFTTAADQTDATKFNACDFMTAKQTVASGAIGNGAVTLDFTHQMAFVELTFGATLNTKVTAVEMIVPQNTVTLDAVAQTTTTSGNAVTIKMYPQTAGQKFWAIVAPQAFTPSTGALFKITTNENKTYSYKPGTEQTFTANNIHKYKLDIKDNSTVFSVSSVTITAWNGSGQTVNGEVTEDEAVKARYTATLTKSTSFLAVGNRSDMNADDQWAKTSYIKVCAYDGETSSLKFQSTDPNWYRGLYYYAGSTALLDPTKKYKITFSGKSAGTNGIQVVVAEKSVNNFYLIGDSQESQNITNQGLKLGTSEFVDKTIYLDAGHYATVVNSNPEKLQNTTPRDFVVCFQAKDSNTDYYIKDLVIEEL